MPPRTRRRSLGALAGIAITFVGAPALLLAVARARLDSPNPLTGMRAPWRWSAGNVTAWFSELGRHVDSTDRLVDVFVRAALVVGWVFVAVLVHTIVSESLFQLRHGMPSSGHRRLLGLGRLGRAIASGLVGLMPLVSTAPALAAAREPVAVVARPDAAEVHGAAAAVPEVAPSAPDWVDYEVQQGDSIWSIAARSDDVELTARLIVEANVGRVMADGSRFQTAALVEPGWVLKVPASAGSRPAALQTTVHSVVPGDSYWRIAEAGLAEQLGRPPTPREVYDYTEVLMDANVVSLGHHDPALILPGEQVVMVPLGGRAAHQEPPPVVVVVELPTATPVDTSLVTTSPVTTSPVTTSPVTTVPVTTVPVTTAPVGGSVPSSAVEVEGAASRVGSVPGVQGGPELSLGAAVLLSAGGIGLLSSRRRQQLRAARVGSRLAAPASEDVVTEIALRSFTSAERIARVDLAVRAAALRLADCGARVVAVVIGGGGDVVLHPDREVDPADPMWQRDSATGSWLLPGTVRLEVLAERAMPVGMPCPALAHLGATAIGDLFVDLEGVGLLCIDGPAHRADDIVRCIAASLAVSPFADSVRLITHGLERATHLGSRNAEAVATLAGALSIATRSAGSVSIAAGGAGTFALRARSRGGEAWEPTVVLVRVDDALALQRIGVVSLAVDGGHGLAVVTNRLVPGARHVLRSDDDGFVLEPLGLRVAPVGVSAVQVRAVDQLLAAAVPPLPVDAEVVSAATPAAPVGHAGDDATGASFVEPPWALMVRVLGHVDVGSCDGESAMFERSKALELVVWLTQHRGRATRTAARTALWELDVRDATFANVVSDARRAMARVIAPPDGEEWLGRTLSEDLPLHPLVVTDAELLARRVAHARRLPIEQAIDVLRPGLELVAGMPFAGTSYLWPDAEGIGSSLTLLVTGAATELANHYLAMGDVEGVFWATGQGLQVIAGHEELIALRMRAHATRGDLSGVRNEWEAYERAVLADSWSSSQPSPKLVAVRRELLTGSAAS